VIAIGPRVLLGIFSAWLYRFFKRHEKRLAGSLVTAVLSTLIHTFMILGMIYLFFGPSYAEAVGRESSHLLEFLLVIILTNGLIEAALAGIIITTLVKVLEPLVKGLN
jgi:uncharacterized membrane protein